MPAMGTPTAVIDAQIALERAWAYECWMARLSYSQMRRLARQPVDAGGLGYDISEQGLRGLVKGAREDRGDLTMSRDERIERQAAEVDARARGAMEDYDRARRTLAEPPPSADSIAMDPVAGMAALKVWQARQAAASALIDAADRRLDAAHKREAALLGLDAATKVEADVTTHDGTLDDLNAALVRLGKAPLGVEG